MVVDRHAGLSAERTVELKHCLPVRVANYGLVRHSSVHSPVRSVLEDIDKFYSWL